MTSLEIENDYDEEVTEWKISRQVPENDSGYLEEHEKGRDVNSKRFFGQHAVNHYEHYLLRYESVLQEVAKFKEDSSRVENSSPQRVDFFSSHIASKLKASEELLGGAPEYLRKDFHDLFLQIDELLLSSLYDERKRLIVKEVRRMFNTPEIQDELTRHFGSDFSGFTPLEFALKIVDGTISNQLLYYMAKKHLEHLSQQERLLEEIVEETKNEFKLAVESAVEQGFLPAAAAQALARLDNVSVKMEDRLMNIWSGKLGESATLGRITVSNEQLQSKLIPRLKKTLFHEFLHEIAGRSISVYSQERIINGMRRQVNRVIYRKNGVQLMIADPNRSLRDWHTPNEWLNEAITEWLALTLSGYNLDDQESAYGGSNSYPEERKELDRLFSLGLEPEVVVKAYFENITSDQPAKERAEHFACLIQRINELDGKFAFNRLENQHIMNDLLTILLNRGVFPLESLPRFEDPTAKIFQVEITIGTSLEASNTRSFCFVLRPVHMSDRIITIEEQSRPIVNLLNYMKKKYGKLKFSITEKLPQKAA